MLLPLLLLASPGHTIAPTAGPVADRNPPVQVWFNSNGDYAYGDHAKVYARSAEDGYLVVLRADVDGRVRVLFPIDPQDEQRVGADKKYELKGRGGRDAFVAEDRAGQGLVLAAYSDTPFRFDEFEKRGHWDYAALAGQSQPDAQNDPEARLMDIVQRMQAGEERYDYDLAGYTVVARQHVVWLDPYPYSWSGGRGFRYGPRFVGGYWIGPWNRFGYRWDRWSR